MPVTATATEARQALMAIADAEFAPEGFVTEDDWLHPSLGHEGTRLACYPEAQAFSRSEALVMDTEIHFQFFDYYDRQIDPEQAVSPVQIEQYAERFIRALQRNNSPSTDHLWYFNLVDIEYPRDPTGNKTRFVARIVAKSGDPSIIETAG